MIELKLGLIFVAGLLSGAALCFVPRPRARTDEQWNTLCVERQHEAWTLGLETGLARGEIAGQQHAFSAIEQAAKERDASFGEVTVEDVERAKRGVLH